MIWIMGSLSEWGLFLALDSGDDFRLGFEVLVMMFTVIRGRIDSYARLELSCSLVGDQGWVIRWVFVIVSVRCMGGFM